MIGEKQALLLDMNSTFMFGEDRFGEDEDFAIFYRTIGGELGDSEINQLIRNVYQDLSDKYPRVEYRHCFPTLESCIRCHGDPHLTTKEVENIVQTFAFHECGEIPDEYASVLFALDKRFILSVVIDIWAPKELWLQKFKRLDIHRLFKASSYSSDHGMVKPSPKPFELVVQQLGLSKSACVVIGDSVRRDLGGATAAGIDCILVDGAQDAGALASFPNLLAFCHELRL